MDAPLASGVDYFNLDDVQKAIEHQHKGVQIVLDNVTKVLQKISPSISVKITKSTLAGSFVVFYLQAKNVKDRNSLNPLFLVSVQDGTVKFVRKDPLIKAEDFRYENARELQKTLTTILVRNKREIHQILINEK